MRIGAKVSQFCAAKDVVRIEAFLSGEDVKPPTGPSQIGRPQKIFSHIAGLSKMTACRLRFLRDTDDIRTGFSCLIDIEARSQPKAATINEGRRRVALEGTDQAIWETRPNDGGKFITDSWLRCAG